jgi:putative ribosome biogenesis GTPase RsgA
MHGREPGCAVAAAARDGKISEQRFASYRRLLAQAEEFGRSNPELRR